MKRAAFHAERREAFQRNHHLDPRLVLVSVQLVRGGNGDLLHLLGTRPCLDSRRLQVQFSLRQSPRCPQRVVLVSSLDGTATDHVKAAGTEDVGDRQSRRYIQTIRSRVSVPAQKMLAERPRVQGRRTL